MPRLNFDFDRLANRTNNIIGERLVKQARKNMDQVSYGRSYIIGGRTHIASKSGDSPNNMTKALRGTIRYEKDGTDLIFGAGSSDVNYAKFLELGTEKMDPRPNYEKSIRQQQDNIDREVNYLLQRLIRYSR